MSKQSKTDLYYLIKSLSKAEKRNFKLFAGRLDTVKEKKFLALFDTIEKLKGYDEETIKYRLKLTSSNLVNLKRHLYLVILKSLRLIHVKKNTEFWLREQIDFAKILYGKGLHFQSLRLLNKVRPIAHHTNESLIIADVLEFQKNIESRHITRSRRIKNKVEGLIEASSNIKTIISNTVELSNLALKIQGYYIKVGLIKNEKDVFIIKDYFRSNLPDLTIKNLGFVEKVLLYQSHMWFEYINLNLKGFYKYALLWVKMFQVEPIMQSNDPDLYMRGLHYAMTASYYARDHKRFLRHLEQLKRFHKENADKLNATSQMMYFIYGTNSILNKYLLNGEYKKALAEIPQIEKSLFELRDQIDQHRSIMLNYKFAWLHFGIGNNLEALDYLNKIIHEKTKYLKDDLKSYANLLHLIIHLEQGHHDLASYLFKSLDRSFKRLDQRSKVSELVFSHLRFLLQKPDEIRKQKAFNMLHKRIERLLQSRFETRVMIYFDFLDWTQSRGTNTPIYKLVRKRYLSK